MVLRAAERKKRLKKVRSLANKLLDGSQVVVEKKNYPPQHKILYETLYSVSFALLARQLSAVVRNRVCIMPEIVLESTLKVLSWGA